MGHPIFSKKSWENLRHFGSQGRFCLSRFWLRQKFASNWYMILNLKKKWVTRFTLGRGFILSYHPLRFPSLRQFLNFPLVSEIIAILWHNSKSLKTIHFGPFLSRWQLAVDGSVGVLHDAATRHPHEWFGIGRRRRDSIALRGLGRMVSLAGCIADK